MNEPEQEEVEKDTTPEKSASTAKRRKRGTGFPVVSLAEAASVLKEAGKYGFEHPTAAFASYMGHSSTNSGAFRQRLSAFRDWDLITGRGDMLSMTDTARMIARPTDPDAERRALQDAFSNCAVFSRLYENTAKGSPILRDRIGGRALHELGVSPTSTAKFVESFVESVVAAELAEIDDDGSVTLWGNGDSEPDASVAPLATDRPASVAMAAPTPASTGGSAPTIRQSWKFDGGDILFELRSGEALPASAFQAIGEVVAGMERLAAALSDGESSRDADLVD